MNSNNLIGENHASPRAVGRNLAPGLSCAPIHYPDQGPSKEFYPKTDARFWRQRLLPRSSGGESENHFAAQVEYEGTVGFFPLGPSEANAAAGAVKIYRALVERGWDFVCRRFPRELTVGLSWCANPILRTYATIHTLVAPPAMIRPPLAADERRVLIIESDAGIRRALEWCVDQRAGLCSVTCEKEKSFDKAFDSHRPALVLLNQNMAARIGWQSPGEIGPLRNGVPALAYDCSADVSALFNSSVAGTSGCLFMGVKPQHLLEPIPTQAGQMSFSAEEILARVRVLFKMLLQPSSGREMSALATLTPRERHVLALVSEGCADKEIAAALVISVWTVHDHLKRIFTRLGARTRTEAAVRYLEENVAGHLTKSIDLERKRKVGTPLSLLRPVPEPPNNPNTEGYSKRKRARRLPEA